jgi:hypothetical protein
MTNAATSASIQIVFIDRFPTFGFISPCRSESDQWALQFAPGDLHPRRCTLSGKLDLGRMHPEQPSRQCLNRIRPKSYFADGANPVMLERESARP